QSIAINSEEGYLAVTQKGFDPTTLINLETGKTHYILRNDPYGQDVFNQAVFSPNGSVVATISQGIDKDNNYSGYGHIQLWDTKSGTLLRNIRDNNTDGLSAISFSPDGNLLLVGATAPISLFTQTVAPTPLHLWDVKTGQMIATLNGHTDTATSI